MYFNKTELVDRVNAEMLRCDLFTDIELLKCYLCGIPGRKPKVTPIWNKKEELAKFLRLNRYRVNLRCNMQCKECSTALVLWCHEQLTREKVIHEEAQEERTPSSV